MRTPPAHRATTAHLQALYPFVADDAFGDRGTLIGRDLFGGSFCFDPWELYRRGVLTNPNLVVIGQIGRGKSTFVKTFLWRQQVFGHQAWVVDPKGEYAALAAACGTVPLSIYPGGQLRLNPLDAGPDHRRRAELLCSLAAASLGRSLLPAERTATELAVSAVLERHPQPILPDVVSMLLDPDASWAATVRTDAAGLAHDGRQVALELRRLVEGDLAGMFDAPTSAGIDLTAPLVVLDLSSVYSSPALGILMTCAAAWLQAAVSAADGIKRLVVVDEAWAILHDLSTARWLQAGFKLARAHGVAYIAVLHRLSDLQAAGTSGSAQVHLAQGLLADSETRVVFGQPPSEVRDAGTLLGLTSTEADLLPHLPQGIALWKVGARSFLVEHDLAHAEAALVDTDAAMREVRP
ncbi:MAG: VirB4 family type IV secretion system protein [Acidimicrobiales bacterium]